ncbi:MAG: hypothetical protein Q8O04_03390 [Deltaproteobacteria bacterium]|nr:hypothetical protein [Deltaproteobacteria bacterium]
MAIIEGNHVTKEYRLGQMTTIILFFAFLGALCGKQILKSKMAMSTVTDLLFKVSETTIVSLKGLPVFQCDGCSEYLLEDRVLKRVEEILEKVDTGAELEVIKYAA